MEDTIRNPFPGLRPFEFGDNHLFFGRDEQTTELTTRLRKNRFVAVVGTSGSGKSSLVRAGLLPELLSGTMAGVGSSWETAIMRPGGDPLTNLANSIVEADLYDPEEEDISSQVRATLTRSGLGLVEAIRQSELTEGSNFLLVVDQFEEIFRFRRSDDATDEQAAFFVNLLLEASAQADLPLYIIITMRSDFLGECSQFPRLADTVNEGEFLIPRLNRDQRKEAIIGPVKVAGGELTDRLLNRLLNDIGDDPDQLPILQHALMRTWDYCENKKSELCSLDLEHYHATGGMEEALSRHADEVYNDLPSDNHRWIAGKLFKALTERVDESRGVRRPMAFSELCEIIEKESEHIEGVIDEYRKAGRTFLMPGDSIIIKPDTIIDISHESLMRVWAKLKNWVDDESQSARIYRRLADTAKLHSQKKAGLYRNPDLQIALSWKTESRPNKTWANRYYEGFDEAMLFLERSHQEDVAFEKQKEEARKKELENIKALAAAQEQKANVERASAKKSKRYAAILGVFSIILFLLAAVSFQLKTEAEDKEEQIRRSYFIAKLQEADGLAEDKKIPKALSALTQLQPKNNEELNLFRARLLSMVSQTQFPKKIKVLNELGKRALFPNGALITKDGEKVAIVSDYNGVGNLHIKNLVTNEELHFKEMDSVRCIDIHYKDEIVAVGYTKNNSNEVVIFDMNQRKLISRAKFDYAVWSVSFSDDGARCLVSCDQGKLFIINAKTGVIEKEIKLPEENAVNRQSLFVNNDKEIINVALGGEQIFVRKLSFEEDWILSAQSNTVEIITTVNQLIRAKLTPDKKKIVVYGNTLKVLNVDDLQEIKNWKSRVVHKAGIPNIAFSHDGTKLITTSFDSTSAICDLSSGEKLYTLKHDINVSYAVLSPDQQKLMIGDWDGFRLWDVFTGKPLSAQIKLGEPIRDAIFLDNGKLLRIVSMYGNISDWDLQYLPPKPTELTHAEKITGYENINDGEFVVTADNKVAKIWARGRNNEYLESGTAGFKGKVIPRYAEIDNKLVFAEIDSPDKFSLYTASLDNGKIKGSLKLVYKTENITFFEPEREMDIDPKGRHFAFYHKDKNKLVVVDLETGKELHNFSQSQNVSQVVYDKKGENLYFFVLPDKIYIHDIRKNYRLISDQLTHKVGYGGNVFPSPSGKFFVSAGGGATDAVLWSFNNGAPEKIGELNHERGINWVSYSSDERLLVTSSLDNTAIVWSYNNEGIEQVSEPLVHENPVPFCSFHTLSNDYVLTIAQNGIVRIWDYKRGSVILGPYSSGDVTSSPVHNGVFINQGKGLINFKSDSNALRIFNITKIDEEQGAFKQEQLIDIAENLLGWKKQLSEPISLEQQISNLKKLTNMKGDSSVKRYLDWYLEAEFQGKSISPFSNITVEQYVDKKIRSKNLSDISEVLRYKPNHPIALAKFGLLYLGDDIARPIDEKKRIAKWYLDQSKKLNSGEVANSIFKELEESLKNK